MDWSLAWWSAGHVAWEVLLRLSRGSPTRIWCRRGCWSRRRGSVHTRPRCERSSIVPWWRPWRFAICRGLLRAAARCERGCPCLLAMRAVHHVCSSHVHFQHVQLPPSFLVHCYGLTILLTAGVTGAAGRLRPPWRDVLAEIHFCQLLGRWTADDAGGSACPIEHGSCAVQWHAERGCSTPFTSKENTAETLGLTLRVLIPILYTNIEGLPLSPKRASHCPHIIVAFVERDFPK